MKHGVDNIVRVNNLMYDECEPHWKCKKCGMCVPFHCYNKEQFAEKDDCEGEQGNTFQQNIVRGAEQKWICEE